MLDCERGSPGIDLNRRIIVLESFESCAYLVPYLPVTPTFLVRFVILAVIYVLGDDVDEVSLLDLFCLFSLSNFGEAMVKP